MPVSALPISKPRRAPRLLLVAAAVSAVLASGCGFVRPVSAQAKPDPLKTVLSEMDGVSARFTTAQADMRQEIFTRAVEDTETQIGQIYFLRKGASNQMGMKLLPENAKPGAAPAQVLELKDGKLRVFNPGTNHIDEFSAGGKNQAVADTLTTLGFGSSGSSLAKSWTITDQGTEQMSDGSKSVAVEKLDLVSKDQNIRNSWTHIAMWIDASRAVPLKQISYQASGGTPTGDTRTVFYTNIRLNQSVDVAPFAIKCKGGCTVDTH